MRRLLQRMGILDSEGVVNPPAAGFWAAILFVALILFIWMKPFAIVPAGERGIVLNWGAVSDKVMEEGLHFRVPIKQKVQMIEVRIQKDQVDATAASKDLQIVTTKIAMNFHLDPEKVNVIWQNLGPYYRDRMIEPAVHESVKAVTARFTAEELITRREEVKEDIRQALKDRLQTDNLIVDNFSIVDFDFSKQFNDSIEAKVKAEQEALTAKNILERVKYEAEQKIAQARGEAESIRIQAESISKQGGDSYIKLQAIEKWDGKLPNIMVPDSTLPFLSLNK